MKILNKNGYKFVSGLDVWQIPDENKSGILVTKTASMFKSNMYCYTKRLSLPTYGFTVYNQKGRIASLALYILEASAIDKKYKNVVICFKFKSAGDLDEDGVEILNDIYGYLFLLNGTISPDRGEDIGDYDDMHNAIYQILSKYEIHVLYLTSDVANKFFNIFERLNERKKSVKQIELILENSTLEQLTNLKNVLDDISGVADNYIDLLSLSELQHSEMVNLIKRLQVDINSALFDEYANSNRSTIRHLTERLQVVDFTSEELYWNNIKLKQIYKNAELKSINTFKKVRKRLLLSLSVLVVVLSTFYYFKPVEEQPKIIKRVIEANKSLPISALQLIKKCVLTNDKYFRDIGKWTLVSIKCDSLSSTLQFSTDMDSTVDEFIKTVGTEKGMSYNNKNAQINNKYNLNEYTEVAVNTKKRLEIISILQQNAKIIGYSINFPTKTFQRSISFIMTSQLSPVFLYNKEIFNSVRLKAINMSFNKNTGLYQWNIQGEI